MLSLKSYICQSPIKHDGEDYGIGDEVDLTDKYAQPLLAVDAVEQMELAPVKPTSNKASADSADRITAIKAAIETLDKTDTSLWLKDGKTPDVKAIEAVLGYDVTAAERNEALA